MIVGSDSSELLSPPDRARWTRSRKLPHEIAQGLPVGVVKRRRDESPTPERDGDTHVDPRARHGLRPAPDRVELGHLAQRERDRLDQQDSVQQPIGHRPREVLLVEPRQRAVHVDGGAEVVVRDLALGARHGGADRLPKARGAVERRPGLFGRGFRTHGRRALDVLSSYHSPRPGAVQGREIDAEFGGELPGKRGNSRSTGSGRGRSRSRLLRGRHRRRKNGRDGGRRRWNGRRAALLPDDREDSPGGHGGARLDEDPLDHAAGEDLDVDEPLVGLHLRDDVPAFHRLARLLAPGGERAGAHVRGQDRHHELSHGLPASRELPRRSWPPGAGPRPPCAWRRAWGLPRCTRAPPARRGCRSHLP